jgi:hypothetical protein
MVGWSGGGSGGRVVVARGGKVHQRHIVVRVIVFVVRQGRAAIVIPISMMMMIFNHRKRRIRRIGQRRGGAQEIIRAMRLPDHSLRRMICQRGLLGTGRHRVVDDHHVGHVVRLRNHSAHSLVHWKGLLSRIRLQPARKPVRQRLLESDHHERNNFGETLLSTASCHGAPAQTWPITTRHVKQGTGKQLDRS